MVDLLSTGANDDFFKSESVAFQGRKIIEDIAFGCLVGIENGMKYVPKEAKGRYNAEKIFKKLIEKKISIIPSPSVIRATTKEETAQYNVKAIIEGIPSLRLTHYDLIKMYNRFHMWAHELNPYTKSNHIDFHGKHSEKVWKDLKSLRGFVDEHKMSICGEAFYCVLSDDKNGQTKVFSASDVGEI